MNEQRIRHLILINNIKCIFFTKLVKRKNWTDEEIKKAYAICSAEEQICKLKVIRKTFGGWKEY